NRILVVKGANDALTPADVDAAGELLRTAGCIVLQLEVPLETVYYTLEFAAQHGIPSILNPAPGQPLDLRRVTPASYVIPNETEAETLSGMRVTNLHEARACAVHLLRQGLQRVIVTLGANGALLATNERVEHIPPYKVDAV